jgi:hypothetical protein
VLYVALSALQGRPMALAFDELVTLGAGIQLTPGNLPTAEFRAHVEASRVAIRRHHGFAWDARRAPVWAADGTCLVDAESVHPPAAGEVERWVAAGSPILEVMYPGFALGTGDEVEAALTAGLPLAVDVSHVFIQRMRGVMTERTWQRLREYPNVAEVHVSANAGRHDTHEPLRDDSFGLAWARERLAAGTPVVLECYMHGLSRARRREQIDLVTS